MSFQGPGQLLMRLWKLGVRELHKEESGGPGMDHESQPERSGEESGRAGSQQRRGASHEAPT